MNPQKKNKLKELLNRIKTLETAIPTGEIKSLTEQIVSEHVSGIGEKLKNDPIVKYLDELNTKIGQFKKDFNLGPVTEELTSLMNEIKSLRDEFQKGLEASAQDGLNKVKELEAQLSSALAQSSSESKNFTSTSIKPIVDALNKLNLDVSTASQDSEGKNISLKESIALIDGRLEKLRAEINTSSQKNSEAVAASQITSDKSVKEQIAALRKELMNRMGNMGGGNMNRNILVNGNPSVMGRYTDLNIKPGANVTLTYTNNNTLKTVDLTIASSGGGGGNSRSVSSQNTSFTADGTAGTDFVYICSAGVQVTMPTASGNTNLYTVKNTAASSILLTPNGIDTIDSQTNLILRTQYTSVDLISDGSGNWNIT